MNNENNVNELKVEKSGEGKSPKSKSWRKTTGGTSWNLYQELTQTLNEDKKTQASNGNIANELEWEIPVPFDTHALPKLDSAIFTPTIKKMIDAVANFTQTPVDLPAIIAIGVLSTIVSKKFVVEPSKGWKEPLNTYTTVLLESSTRKSAAYNAMSEPIYLYENDLIDEMRPKIQKRFAERGALTKRIEKLQNDYAKTSDPAIKEDIKNVVDELQGLPELQEPALLLDNATEEVIVKRLKQNNEKIALLSPEGDFFENLKMIGKDSEKNDVYLKGYSGDPLRTDRITRDTERLNEPLITICISAQPTVIQNMPKKLNDRGLIPRFLFSIPYDFVGYRDVLSAYPIPDEIRDKYISFIKKLLNFSADKPFTLNLDREAESLLSAFRMEVEVNFREGGVFHDHLKAWGGKLVGQLIRIAGILHVTKHAEKATRIDEIPTTIDKETLTTAIQLKDYFIPHVEKAFGIIKATPILEDAQYILKKLFDKQKLVIDKQEVWQTNRSRFATSEDLNYALNVLESRYYIKRGLGGKSGRKEIIYINPLLFQPNSDPNPPSTWRTVENKEKKEGESKNLKIPNSPKGNTETKNKPTTQHTAQQEKYKVVQEL